MTYHEAAALDQSASGRRSSSETIRQSDLRQWTIKNLEPEVVEKARAAAKKTGMKINAWVSATLANAANAELVGNPPNRGNLAEDLNTIVSEIEAARSEHRLMIERIEKDISQLVKGQHGMLVEMLGKKISESQE